MLVTINDIELMKKDYQLCPMLLALKLVTPKSKVLSIGCGSGREVKYLVKELGCEVTAIDNDKRVIEESLLLEPSAKYLNVNALSMDLIIKEEYDFIVCLWNTINFFKKDERKKLIEICYDRLKIGGKLIITTSHVFQHWTFPLHNVHHREMYYPLPSEIELWFKDTKFKMEKIKVDHSYLVVAEKQ